MKQRTLLLLIISVVYVSGYFALERWKMNLYYGDSNGYYLHVVSFFINNDVGDYDKTITELREINPNSGDPREDKYGIRLTSKGRRYIKYTLGVPVMETPFFLLAHAYAKWSNKYDANGWTSPYLLIVSFSTVFYVLAGFWLLIPIVQRYFKKWAVVIGVLTLAFATNLFFQATYITMSHSFLFFDYCLLLHLTIRFYDQPSSWRALFIGMVVGLIALTRVPEVISILIPVLWGVTNVDKFRARVTFFIQNYSYLLLAALGLLIGFSLQFCYWYYVSGALVFNPYDGEGFNFLKPQIWNGFFHFQNGWLIYTPVMAFSLIGLFFIKRYFPDIFLPILAFVGLHAFIHYSYYAWTFFPGLGQRPMVETYALLVFPLTAFFATVAKRKWLNGVAMVLLAFFTWLNLFQTWQMKEGIIWSERGNAAFYYETFGRLSSSKKALIAYDTKIIQPDSSDLKLVNNLGNQTFEDSLSNAYVSSIQRSGKYTYLTGSKDLEFFIDSISMEGVESGDWLRIQTDAFMHPVDQLWQRDNILIFGLQLFNEEGKRKLERSIRLSGHIGNNTYSIWSDGVANVWDQPYFYVRVPKKINEKWTAKVFAYNPNGQKLYLDNVRLDHYRAK